MFVDFEQKGQIKTLGPFDEVEIVDVALVADGKKIAFFNRDESYWSEDWSYDTVINNIAVWH